MLGAVLLCNLYHSVTTSQLGVVLGDSAQSGDRVAVLISAFVVSAVAVCCRGAAWGAERDVIA